MNARDRAEVEQNVPGGSSARLRPEEAEVYSLGGPPQTHKELIMASTLTFGPGTKASHAAAIDLYEWLRFPLQSLHVTIRVKRSSRDGITAHHASMPMKWKFIDHIPVTGPERTVLDAASIVDSDKTYRRIVRQAQIEDTTYARLVAMAAMSRGARGVARLKRELRDGPSRTRSTNEDEVLEVFRHGGEPVANAIVHGHEVDLYFPGLNVVVEVQSPLHDSPTAQADDLTKKHRLERRGVRVLWIR